MSSAAATFSSDTSTVALRDVCLVRTSIFSHAFTCEYDDPKFTDVILKCAGGEEVASHKLILASLSSFLRRVLLRHDRIMGGGTAETTVISLPDINASELENFLKNAYYGGTSEVFITENLFYLGFGSTEEEEEYMEEDELQGKSSRDDDYPSNEPKVKLELVEEGETQNYVPSYKPSRKFSLIWSYFTDLGDETASCIECDLVIATMSGKTSGLSKHLRLKHPESFRQIELASKTGFVSPDFLTSSVFPVDNRKKHRSLVWKYFTSISKDIASCQECNQSIGVKKGKTSGMIKHLKSFHPDSYQAMLNEKMLSEQEEVKEERNEGETECKNAGAKSLSQDVKIPIKISKKRSGVWDYFTLQEDEMTCVCKLCGKALHNREQRTSNMIRHLHRTHFDEYREYAEASGLETKPVPMRRKAGRKKALSSSENGEEQKIKEDPAERTCPVCLKVYSTKRVMLYHQKVVHSGVKPYKCEQCGAEFARLTSYKNHTHSNTKTYLCSVCGKLFLTPNARAKHERSHFGVRKQQCSYCERRFLTGQQKRNHELIHTGEKNFECDTCGKRFARPHQLKNHLRVHSGERPYTCKQCSQSFKHLSSKNNHKCSGSGLIDSRVIAKKVKLKR